MKIRIHNTECNLEEYMDVLKKYNQTFDYPYYHIEIETLEELLQLQRELEKALIIDSCYNGTKIELEIYDGYRE